jgi:hypothetical protein
MKKKTVIIILYERPSDGRWEWHALKGKTYIAVSPCIFLTKLAAKRSANACAKAFKNNEVIVTWGN